LLSVVDPDPGEDPVTVSIWGLKLTGASGAAVSNSAALELSEVWIHGNAGSGVDNLAGGWLVLSNSTLSANVTGGTGGGLRNYGTAVVVQSTISQNRAATGAGIYNGTGASLAVGQSTIVLNRASGSGGGIFTEGAAATLTNTLVALNRPAANAPDVSGAFSALSRHNLIGVLTAAATGLDDPSSQWGTVEAPLDPVLGGFGISGDARMPIHQLLAGSPAVDAGDNTLAVDAQGDPLGTDQRGLPRISGAAVDIGAAEGAAAIALDMTGPTGVVQIGHTTQITWDATVVPMGGEVRLYYDGDDAYNGNEEPIVVQVDTSWAPWGRVDWAPVLVPAGDWTVGGTVVQAGTGTVLAHGRVPSPVTIDYSSACTVTTADDRELAGDGLYSLRECILAANANAGSDWTDVIVFDASLDGQTIQLTTSDFEITDRLVIRGGTADGTPLDITVSGADTYRIFRIQPSAGSVILDNLTLTNGYTTAGGGAIWNDTAALELRHVSILDSQAVDSHGGGIYTTGPTKLIDSRVDGCLVEDLPNPDSSLYGGAIYSTGNLEVIRSEITDNRVLARGNAFGGGIYSSGPRLAISDSLIGGNTAQYLTSNNSMRGGGIYKLGGVLDVERTTIVDNTAFPTTTLAAAVSTPKMPRYTSPMHDWSAIK
jgi:hypothetical protein